jgi:tetratricopeptide (TPR) repeat protein
MLSEEALVLYAAAAACVLLVLGVLELLAPTRPRHPRRGGAARDPWRRARTTSTPARARVSTTINLGGLADSLRRPEPPGRPAAPLDILARSEHPSGAGVPGDLPVPSDHPHQTARPLDSPVDSERSAEPPKTPVGAPGDVVARPEEPAPEALTERASLVDRCFALHQEGRFPAVITEAMAALETVRAAALFLEPGETAKLWGLVALARQAMGERDGARAALEEALAVSPSEDRATWQRHLAALALEVGQDLVAQAQSGTADAEERVTTLHAALGWLESGLAVAPDDGTLREAATAARAALWPTYEQSVSELLQRQDYQVARRVLRQAQAEENCPAELQTSFREMLASTYGGEVGQLTAEAIKRMQEGNEGEALVTLDRAEEMLGMVPEGGLPAKRRNELERRLWWSYTKVGIRRVEGGLYEEALPPLLHALGYHGVGSERREETKLPLVRALEAIVAARSPLIQRMIAEGDRDGALILCEKLWSFLHGALERGLTREELAVGLAQTQAFFEKLGKPRP